MKKYQFLLNYAAVANVALAEDHISVHYLSYEEYDDRVSSQWHHGFDWEKYRLRLDTFNAEISYDSVSGASQHGGQQHLSLRMRIRSTAPENSTSTE